MPPIPIYSHSPISAAKADGVTPQTAEKSHDSVPPPPTTTQGTAGPPPPANNAYPPAQPGSVPSIPAPTGAASLSHQYTPPQPTPTQPLASQGPPPPQPGAVPVPPGAATTSPAAARPTNLPPPPKAGEPLQPATQTQPQGFYPPQMSMPAPTASATQGAQRGTSTAFVAQPSPMEHPPGYQQNPNAGELDRYQRAAQEALERDEEDRRRSSTEGGAGGVWGSVKGAMMAAGEKIAAAEEDVWKRINKDL